MDLRETQNAGPFPAGEGDAQVERAVQQIEAGGIVIVTDDEGRENEGDLVMAAASMTAEGMAFFLEHTSGLVCVGVDGDRVDELQLPAMTASSSEAQGAAFTVSVDIKDGLTTGISAAERARTIRGLADPTVTADNFVRPGHVFPLRARAYGVLERRGHTEGAADLARLAGRPAAGALCEVVSADKRGMARGEELEALSRYCRLPIVSIASLAAYRLRHETLVRKIASARIPTPFGEMQCQVWRSQIDGSEHVALVHGDMRAAAAPLVRVHSECLTGDVFGSLRCDCGVQVHEALRQIATEGRGALIYMRGHEGRGIGLPHKLAAYNLQDAGYDTVDANSALGLDVDSREYGIAAQILKELGARRVRLLTNNPTKCQGLRDAGLDVVCQVPLHSVATEENLRYLTTKRDRMGHSLPEFLAVGAGS
jgi:3,4-dihydroxy 2-butanone 4-phosphate synthase/GTP cyclohydrolase II